MGIMVHTRGVFVFICDSGRFSSLQKVVFITGQVGFLLPGGWSSSGYYVVIRRLFGCHPATIKQGEGKCKAVGS